MTWIIKLLRIKVNDSQEEIWSDDELQTYLDMHRRRLNRVKLACDGNSQVFQGNYGLLEGCPDDGMGTSTDWSGTGDPTDVINIWSGTDEGAAAETPDSFNLVAGTFIFDSRRDDEPYYMDGYAYDLEAAIAECLEQLAMDLNRAKRWSRGIIGHTHYDLMEMAERHRKLAGFGKARLIGKYDDSPR